jgi:hypothetical protein
LPAPSRTAFREHWTPALSRKLGRPLNAADARHLENLAALFGEFVQAHGALYPGGLLRHGFEYTPPPGAPLHAPAYPGWWDDTNAPADPWALWQFIAHDYERHGRPIPEVFQPLTNTAALPGLIEERQVQQELTAWRRAFAVPEDAAVPGRTHPATADIAGLRARVRVEGGLAIETRPAPGKPWRSPPQKWFAVLATARPIDFEHLSPPEAALGIALASECAAGMPAPTLRQPLPAEAAANLFRTRAAREAIVLPDGKPLAIEPHPLALEARTSTRGNDRLELRLVTPDGRDASRATVITLRPSPVYFF